MQTCSGEGNQAGGERGLGARGHREGLSLRSGLSPSSRGSGSGRHKPPVRDWHSVSESVREGAWRRSPEHDIFGRSIIEAGEHHGERHGARDRYSPPASNERGSIDPGETETGMEAIFWGLVQPIPSVCHFHSARRDW